MDTFIKRLEFALHMREETQASVARSCQVSKGTLSNWKNNPDIEPNARIVKAIAQHLRVRYEWLDEGTGAVSMFDEVIKQPHDTVPVFDYDSLHKALKGSRTVKPVGDTRPPKGVSGNDLKTIVATPMPDDSMSPLIPEGATVYIQKQKSGFRNGNIVAAVIDDEVFIRRYIRTGKRTVLRSPADGFEDLDVDDEVTIMGRVVEHAVTH